MTKEEYWVEIIKMSNALEIPCTFSPTREKTGGTCMPAIVLGRISGAEVIPIQEAHRILKHRMESHTQHCLQQRDYFDSQLDALEAVKKGLK